jgi:hypothetical protein
MKSAHSLVLLSVLAALSLTSCGHDWSWSGGGYKRVPPGGTYYGSNFNGAPSFGGHGGGYGNGYSVWPQPTINYGENFTYEDEPTNVGNSWDHGGYELQTTRTNLVSRQESYDTVRTSGK